MGNSFRQNSNSQRQKLIPDDYFSKLKSLKKSTRKGLVGKKRESVEDVLEHLQDALELEHSTIPPYLCALYSIKEGSNKTAIEIVRSVVIEEMLHMVMVANLINALGGKPRIGGKNEKGNFIPTYPTALPGNVMPGFEVGLNYFSPSTIRGFEKIEHPGDEDAVPPKGLDHSTDYDGIGAFYNAILADLIALEEIAIAEKTTIFNGKTKQVSNEHYYGAGGKIVTVNCLDDAIELIEEIVGQGEGSFGSIFSEGYDKDKNTYQIFGPDIEEYAHYFRFKEVQYGRFYAPTDSAHRDGPNKGLPTGEAFDRDWEAAHKMRPNPKLKDYPKGSDLYNLTLEFNQTYMALLENLNEGCNGKPELLKLGIPLMYDLKNKAVQLMNIPFGKEGFVAGPTFEYTECN